MKDKILDKITDIIAYALLPITLPIHLWKTRNWGKKNKKFKKIQSGTKSWNKER